MIWLLAGSDSYRIKQKLDQITAKTKDSVSLIGEPFDVQQIKAQAQTLPFFVENQAIVLSGFLKGKNKESQKEMKEFLAKVPEFTELIFLEEELDERLALVKELRKTGKVEIFGELKGAELTNWIVAKVKEKGGTIDRNLADRLGLMIGADLVRLENEIDKLVNYDPNISATAIENLVDEGFFESIFTLMDALSEKNSDKAIKLLGKFMGNENNELYLLSMLARQTRNLLTIKDLAKKCPEPEIVKITKLHPFIVKKTLAQAKNFQPEELLAIHRSLIEADLALKSSATEPKVVLTKLVYNFSK